MNDASDGPIVSLKEVVHLRRMWSRVVAARSGKAVPISETEHLHDKILLAGLGLAVEETTQYLCRQGPGFEEFEAWILQRNNGRVAPERIERLNRTLQGLPPAPGDQAWFEAVEKADPVLSRSDLEFWDENGYVIVRNAISKPDSQATADTVWRRLGMDPGNPETWYGSKEKPGIMVQFFHHPTLQRNRESSRVHKAFAQLWGTADLWVTTDRVSFNPPERPGHLFSGPHLHWDTSVTLPIPLGLQGVLYLTDTAAEQGAFTCVPGFHRKIAAWLGSLPPGADPRTQDLEALGAIGIAASAGDLIVWHHALPHGSRPNRAHVPRLVQYLTMFPAVVFPEREWR